MEMVFKPLEDAVRIYLEAIDGEPEKDAMDQDNVSFASDWSHRKHDAEIASALEQVRAALSASALLPQEGEIEIKPLEWTPWTGSASYAYSAIGDYSVDRDEDEDMAETPYVTWGQDENLGHHPTLDMAQAAAQEDFDYRIRSALALPLPVQEKPVASVPGWHPIETIKPSDGMILIGYGEYRERDGFSPAFMRWYDSVKGWSVNAMPFYPTHWMPLPASPSTVPEAQGTPEPVDTATFAVTHGELRRIREVRGIGLREMAKEIGISSATLHRAEHGETVSVDVAAKLGPWIGKCMCCGQPVGTPAAGGGE